MENREIKFRFWDNGCMIYPNYWGCGNMGWFYGLPWEDDTYVDIAMQYTGLKDKNGKEIYEGDIVYVAGTGICLVEFDMSAWLFNHEKGLSFFNEIDWIDVEEIKGNIYENPELI